MALVECIPNFSEGRDRHVVKAITDEIEAVDGATLLDVDPGEATNRTVVTFAGTPEAVVEAAFRAIKEAKELIDMSVHKGEHPRMGATDVCPLVPISGITVEECVELAHKLAKRVGDDLEIPVYLYEHAATSPERKSLADIRKGEYEGLAEKLKNPNWAPDYGPARFDKRAGATVVGVREFLIAYNVNLNTRNKRLAHEVALNIREMGRAKRDEKGKILRDEEGKIVREKGRLKCVRAVGWYIDEYNMAQISINLTNYKVTPLYRVFDECCKEADKLGLRVTGSEVVGLIPRDALLEAGRHYLLRQGRSAGVPEKELIRIAIQTLGLSEIKPFIPGEKIIEYRVENKKSLLDAATRDFIDEVSMDSPAPGGGSVSALSGAFSGALLSMVCILTVGKKGYEDAQERVKEIGVKAQGLKDELIKLVDEDTEAFNGIMSAMRLPKKTEEDKKKRDEAVEKATKKAILVPLRIMHEGKKIMELLKDAAGICNVNAISDIAVAALEAETAVKGAALNVDINIPNVRDEEFRKGIGDERKEIEEEVVKMSGEIERMVRKRMG
ncbi:glutamate formimidoyltransferase [candidate division WOR-3 bacterium JGI_Cruoil_03_44_89]|uniref:Formimidoyltransferase-cyclodeaminase n=1 Tax=candidate division WOR-3 bacterium JGI_Cruoil_03_44_89 TaxID=1973748 RepID=A0A235BZ08_UNCW3|nr:MAG: glutamate formimidoyltransferase [candidate division WOR-3 bacterium JGI_Cruoil_03_44_89]